MKRVGVADTGPLIALATVTKLDLLRRLYGCIVVPPSVRLELAIDSAYPGARGGRSLVGGESRSLAWQACC